jgi:hypothetical protein
MARKKAARKRADARERSELQVVHLDVVVAGRGADAGGDRFAFFLVARGERHARAVGRERSRRFLAEPARAAGDEDDLSG